jgi:glycosyltransferase EpsF
MRGREMNNFYPIRILHVVGAMNIAGTETMLMNIYRNLDRAKVQFDFISYQQNAHYDDEIKRMGGRIIRLSNTHSVKEIYEAIKKYGPYHAVHSHTLFHCGIANLAAKLAKVNVRIAHAHTTMDICDSLIRKLYIKAMRYIINTFSTKLLACSNQAGKYLFGEKGLNKPFFTYFPNLIEYPKFLQEPKIHVLKFKDEKGLQNSLVIGHIGRFIETKNQMFLLDIIKNMLKKADNVKLVLVGDGDLRLQIEEAAKCKGLDDNIIFIGLRNDIPTILHVMDIFVFPSIYEGLGLVLLEAQASGLPCVVSEAIQPEADLDINLFSRLSLADGAEVWANKILELAGKKEKDAKKIINGFEANGYSLSQGISKLLNIYQLTMGDA